MPESGNVSRTPDRILTDTENLTNAKVNQVASGSWRVDAGSIGNRELTVDIIGGFDTVSDLRANTDAFADNTRIPIKGYWTAEDGWFGPDLIVDTADTTTADDGFSCFVDTNGLRFKRVFNDPVNVKWAGAKGDDANDDTNSIQTVLSYMLTSGRRGKVVIPPGTYKTSATLTVNGASIEVEGEASELSTIVKAYHTAGPVFKLVNRRQALRNIEIQADSVRQAASATTYNHGVVIEEADSPAKYPTHIHLENLYIIAQPASGVVAVGGYWFGKMERMTIRDCGAHGVVFTDGTYPTNSTWTARTNRDVPPGICDLNLLEIFDNDGHGLLLGNPDSGRSSDRCIRMQIRNVDVGRNAQSSGTRIVAAQLYGFFDTSWITHSAFDGKNKAGSASTTRCIECHGKSIHISNNRMINPTPQAIKLGGTVDSFTTENIVVEDNYLIKGTAVTWPLVNGKQVVDRAIIITAGQFVDGMVNRRWSGRALMEAKGPYGTTDTNQVTSRETVVQYLLEDLSINNDTTMKSISKTRTNTWQPMEADNPGLWYPVFAQGWVGFDAEIFVTGSTGADVQIAVEGPTGASCLWGPMGGIRVDGGGSLAQQDAIGSAGTGSGAKIAFGVSDSQTRRIDIGGFMKTSGSGGHLVVMAGQGVAVSDNTTIKAGSKLIIHK